MRDSSHYNGHSLFVLVGGDYSGKTSLLRQVRHVPGWRVASLDDEVLPDDFDFVRVLKREFLDKIAADPTKYSPRVVVSCLHVAVSALENIVEAALETGNVLVESYYYKLIAKCIVYGWHDERVLSTWRSMRRPERAFLLTVDAELAWERSRQGRPPNAFERRSSPDAREGFVTLQNEVEREMLRQLGNVPVERLDGDDPVARLKARLRERSAR